MRDATKVVAAGVLAIGVMILLMWGFTGNDFFLYKYFGPKQEAVRRVVFENTKSYRQGMVQDLQNMQFEYYKATPEQKDSLASIILHRAADVPEDVLTPSLIAFINELHNRRIER